MEYALSRSARQLLAQLSCERTLYAFDFDGTLSPIVSNPDHAVMSRRTRGLLTCLAAARPCIVVSGRGRADLMQRVSGVGLAQAIGNHGAETSEASRAPRRRIAQWKAALEPALRDLPGVWVEDKDLSLAVHYRQAPKSSDARCRILAAARTLPHARVFGGKRVVNLVLDTAPHKGQALAAERDRLGCDWVLYVGDDKTDEDAFALCGNIVPVRIGVSQRSHARYYLRTQREIDRLLAVLVRKTKAVENALVGHTVSPADQPQGQL
uniref:Trehalose 6-phosphate phosphatase n=1 Tax=Solibacter usitatus (strain Ellin6076) TaxID=234267 RepID=Q029X7_SOLUE